MSGIPDATWIGLCREEYEERCNPYSHWEEEADYEAEEADRQWKEGTQMTTLTIKTERGEMNFYLEKLFDSDDAFKPIFCTKRTLNEIVKLIKQYATREQIEFLFKWLQDEAPWYAEKYEKILQGGKSK